MTDTKSAIVPGPPDRGGPQESSAPNGSEPDLAHVRAWIFDLDNTLYPASCNLFAQIDKRMQAFVSESLRVDLDEAWRIQKHYFREYGTTLRGLMIEHGLHPDAFLEYVHAIDVSGLPPCADLHDALAGLPGRKIIFTNGSQRHAENVIRQLGIDHHFQDIFDISAAEYIPKPDPATYAAMVKRHAVNPAEAIFFEDTARNLIPASRLGMTTAWVRTDRDWAAAGADASCIHHVIDDLPRWLGQVASRPKAVDRR